MFCLVSYKSFISCLILFINSFELLLVYILDKATGKLTCLFPFCSLKDFA